MHLSLTFLNVKIKFILTIKINHSNTRYIEDDKKNLKLQPKTQKKEQQKTCYITVDKQVKGFNLKN